MNSPLSPSVLSRRTLLKGLAVAGVAGLVPRHLAAQPAAAASSLLDYLAAHQRADGGYAFADQERSHLTPTFAVIGAYKLLGQLPPRHLPHLLLQRPARTTRASSRNSSRSGVSLNFNKCRRSGGWATRRRSLRSG